MCPHMGELLSDGDMAATIVSYPLRARRIDLFDFCTGEVKNG